MPSDGSEPDHPDASEPDRRRPRTRLRTVVGVSAAAVVLVAAATATVVTLTRHDADPPPPCPSGRTALRVTVVPDIAPVVTTVADRLTAEPAACLTVSVTASAPERVLADLQAGAIQPPDVWIPNSTLWLTRAKDDKVATAADAPAIATSPLVLSMSAAEAARLQPGGRPTVSDLVNAAISGAPASVAIATQRLAPERVGTILALRAATATRPDGRAALTALLRAATLGIPAGSGTGGAGEAAIPTTEQAVWASNAASDTTGQPTHVAIYPSQASYDYPYAVLASSSAVQAAAGRLLDQLTLPSSQQAIRSAGFRDATGAPGFDLVPGRGVDGAQSTRASRLDGTSLAEAEKTLSAVRQDAKLITVIDVSGSMAWGVAGKGTPGPSRLDIARAAALRGLTLYPSTTEVDLWAFSEKLDGDKDYRVVVPTTTLDAAGKSLLTTGLATLHAEGGTGLYATTLAAVRAAQRTWAPGRVNAVVILSDGADTQGPMTLDQLVGALRAERGSAPVPVITIAFGPDADRAAMTAISAATGGAAYHATSPDEIQEVFLDAVGQRACRPKCGT